VLDAADCLKEVELSGLQRRGDNCKCLSFCRLRKASDIGVPEASPKDVVGGADIL
jgi:hypothetical protein